MTAAGPPDEDTADDHPHSDAIPGAILDETATLGGLLNPLVVFPDTNLAPWWTLPLDVLAERLSARPREAYVRALKKDYRV